MGLRGGCTACRGRTLAAAGAQQNNCDWFQQSYQPHPALDTHHLDQHNHAHDQGADQQKHHAAGAAILRALEHLVHHALLPLQVLVHPVVGRATAGVLASVPAAAPLVHRQLGAVGRAGTAAGGMLLGLLVALVADVAEQRVCELPLVVHHVGLHPQPLHGTVNLVDVLVLVCGGSGESRTRG